MNITGGGGGGGGGIDPGGNGGNLTTNLFIKKIKTIHTSEGTKIKIKSGNGRTLEALKLIIDGGGGGGGGGVGKGGDGGSIFTNLTINKLKTVFRNGANKTTVEVQNPLSGLSLNINGGGGGGGGGPGQGGDGGDLVTNIVIGKAKTVTKNEKMNISIIYVVLLLLLVFDDNCSAGKVEDNQTVETREKDTEKKVKGKVQPLERDFEKAISNAKEVNLADINGNYSLNITGGGNGGSGRITPSGDGGNITTNFVIKKIRTIHTSEGSKTLIKTGDGRKLTLLNLIIDGGGGGGGGGIGKGGDGGGIITNLLIKKIQTEHRKGSKAITSGSEGPLHGVSLNIKGGGGGGGGGPGPGGKGGSLVTNVVIGKLQQKDSRNGSAKGANQKEKKIAKDVKNKLKKAAKNKKKEKKLIEKEGKETKE
ncbi:RNA-binding protein cabeza-like [Mytilus californianus]|uniref:RNA-binding protein cabeza-like n=1 Tax=Mytilus californianus TaxID=6549 RepID=UPI002247610D|nr:RNA-binding protein cabeza-like [Mytilus californianus]